MVAAPLIEVADALTSTTSRGRLAPPVGVLLGPTRTVAQRDWIYPERIVFDGGIPRQPLMPVLKGHFWCDGVRQNIVGLGGRKETEFRSALCGIRRAHPGRSAA